MSAEYIEKYKNSTSIRNYVHAGELLGHFLEASNNRGIDEITMNKFKSLMRLMRVADDIIESQSDREKRLELYDYVISRFRNCEQPENSGHFENKVMADEVIDEINSEILEGIPDNRKKLFITTLRSLFEVTEKLKSENDIDEFTYMVRLEGQVTSRYFYYYCRKKT